MASSMSMAAVWLRGLGLLACLLLLGACSRAEVFHHEAFVFGTRVDVAVYAEDQADADAAMARIQDAVAEADALIDGFLAKRGYTLPLAPVPKLVTGWSRSIARYLLHKSRISMESNDPIVRDYRDALKLLQLTADGKFSLGADDTVATGGSSTDVRFSFAEPVFGRKQLNSFR